MSVIQSLLGGPLLLAYKSADNPGTGVETTLFESTYERGEVVQFMKFALVASQASVTQNSLSNLDGGFANAGLIDDEDDGFFALVNSKSTVPSGFKAPLVVQGQARAMVFLADDGGGDTEATTEGQKVYAVVGQKYLTIDPAFTGVGRCVGRLMETVAAGGRPVVDGANLMKVLFNGLPPELG